MAREDGRHLHTEEDVPIDHRLAGIIILEMNHLQEGDKAFYVLQNGIFGSLNMYHTLVIQNQGKPTECPPGWEKY